MSKRRIKVAKRTLGTITSIEGARQSSSSVPLAQVRTTYLGKEPR